MEMKAIKNLMYDLEKMLPAELSLKSAKTIGERFIVLGQYKSMNIMLEFEGLGSVKISRSNDGYVSYIGRFAHNPKGDVMEIIRALAGECKSYKGIWHWKGETYTQSVPI